jgi:cell division protein FtsI/penicillin-binding protein 2
MTLAFTACSSDVDVASLRGTAQEFVDAWLAQDGAGMTKMFDEKSAAATTSKDLEKELSKALDDGAITLFDVELGSVEQPEAGSEEELAGLKGSVPYTITYSSRAADEPFEFKGAMDFVYESDSWKLTWDDSYMWPGNETAGGFEVDVKESRRAPILDRNGKVLARGSGDKRSYPYGSVAGSTIGHVAPLSKKNAKEDQAPGEFVGVSGLEAGIDDRLNAASATELLLVDTTGDTIEVLGSKEAGKPEPVKTTIDIKVQRAAENAYGNTVGGAVVIDPATGDLLAVVSSSPFDPNNYVGVESVTPFNRALSGTYPPGSSMKVVTASAAVEEGVVTPKTMVTGPANYKGVRNFDSGTFGSIPFSVATQNSVNTAFAQVAEDLGGKRMKKYAEAFGFNHEPTMPLGAATPSFPKPEDLTDVMWSAIGQAQVVATPLEMATIAATVANDGTRMEPRILLDSAPEGVEAVSPKTARIVTELMEGVVTGGTGTAANLGNPTVAGKTGTAEVQVGGGIQNHAWFICFAPSDKPEVAIAVVSEFGGIGGEVAAPIAGRMLAAVLPLVK